MESTVQPDRNDTDAVSIIPDASSAGLIMTPPPIPQMEPAADEKKQISRIINSFIISILLSSYWYSVIIKKGVFITISNHVFRMDFFAFYRIGNSFHFGQAGIEEHLV